MNREAFFLFFPSSSFFLLSLSHPTHLCSTRGAQCHIAFIVAGVAMRCYAANDSRHCNILEATKTKYKTPITFPFIFWAFFFLLKNGDKLVKNVCLLVPESSCILVDVWSFGFVGAEKVIWAHRHAQSLAWLKHRECMWFRAFALRRQFQHEFVSVQRKDLRHFILSQTTLVFSMNLRSPLQNIISSVAFESSV